MSAPLVIILMGSGSDAAHCGKIEEGLKALGVVFETRVGSAHKTPAHVSALLAEYEASGRPRVYITVAGRSNALSGFVDGAVLAPVIACPPPSEVFAGADLFSSLRMPGGIAPAYIQDPGNAALLAAKILAGFDPGIAQKLAAFKQGAVQRILEEDEKLHRVGAGGLSA